MLAFPHRLFPALVAAGLLVIVLIARGVVADVAADPDTGRPDQAVLVPPAGALAPDVAPMAAIGDGYLSPVTAAPRPFTHMLLRWDAFEPVSDTLTLEVRASLDGTTWTDWGLVPENPDLWVPEDGDQVYWSQEIYAGEGARFWQVRASLVAAPDGRLPELRRIEVNTVDARFGPPDPPADLLQPMLEGASVARPPVVSRTAWGSPDGQGSRKPPAYRNVSHMVVHHTADSNSLTPGQRWSDRVRAIWSFHAITRGWGDIGYNFLIDPNGVVYEGRAGGDDAVAFHDTANYGSMGVALIGTYAGSPPPAAAMNTLVELLAWKANQKDIDPLGSSFYYGCSISQYCAPFNTGSIVHHISGHRHVTPGHTSCPGNSLEALIPQIRQRVQDRISGQPGDNGDLTIDERESSFERSDAPWYEWPCGYEGSTFYTFGTDNPAESTNRAIWRPNLPTAGRYQVFVSLPKGCDLGQPTARAVYKVVAADGTHEVVIDQSAGEEWVNLGSFDFAAGRVGYVELGDLTGEPLISQRVIYFDSVRWVKEDPAAAKLELLDVRYDRTSLPAGELLKVTFTVRNSGPIAVEGQAPEAARPGGGAYDLAESYVYDEGECFLGANGQGYPAYPKELGRIRLMLGPTDGTRVPACAGESGGYPWRWGINGRLEPGATREVVGYLRLRTPGQITLQAGAVNEYVSYLAQGVGATTITVTPERQPPLASGYDELLRPLAHVYRLGEVPDNFLARARDAGVALRGPYVGSFAWQGETRDWGTGGPLAEAPDLADRFLVEQLRTFVAPEAGLYSFQVTGDDGAWLWVNGQLVAGGAGESEMATWRGSIALAAGRHVLAFKGLERAGSATMGYAVQAPGQAGFGPLLEGLGGVGTATDERLGATFRTLGGLTLTADDLGGSGVTTLRVAVDGAAPVEYPGGLATLGALPDGDHEVRYLAVDGAGNQSTEQILRFRVDSSLVVRRTYLPIAQR
ncbi:MAG: N-acetylmuramoyl-L-alanine amidase [Chloroflexi bacterium OHK40]